MYEWVKDWLLKVCQSGMISLYWATPEVRWSTLKKLQWQWQESLSTCTQGSSWRHLVLGTSSLEIMLLLQHFFAAAIDWIFVFPSPKFIYFNRIPSVTVFGYGAFGMWLCHEGGACVSGISAFIKETPDCSLAFLCHVSFQQNMAIYEPGSMLSPDTKSASALILDFPAPKRFLSHLVYGILV